jgi:transcriptional regulator with XRE-family HTH domain
MQAGNALAEYLRARRELVSPESAGIPHIGRRRVPGLRRDEVSLLAGVSTDYYVRLEQGRDRNPSPQVLDALARALQLDDEATAHLHALAGHERRVRRSGQRPERVPPSIQQLIAGWHDTPAFVQGRRLDVLAANPLATALSPQFTRGVNLLHAAFLDPAVRTLYGDQWESLAHNTIAGVRALLGPEVDDPLLNELVGELSVRSDHFRTLWARHDIRARISGGTRHMHHPQIGELELHYENLRISGTDGQTLIIYHADPGSRTAQALARLATTLTPDSSHGSTPSEEAAISAPTGVEPQHRPVTEPQPQHN